MFMGRLGMESKQQMQVRIDRFLVRSTDGSAWLFGRHNRSHFGRTSVKSVWTDLNVNAIKA